MRLDQPRLDRGYLIGGKAILGAWREQSIVGDRSAPAECVVLEEGYDLFDLAGVHALPRVRREPENEVRHYIASRDAPGGSTS